MPTAWEGWASTACDKGCCHVAPAAISTEVAFSHSSACLSWRPLDVRAQVGHCPGNPLGPSIRFGDTLGATGICSFGVAILEVVPLCATYRHKSKFLKTLIETTADFFLKKNLLLLGVH